MKKIIILFISCIVVLACNNSGETVQVKTLEPGDTAPEFSLKNVDKKMVSLSDYTEAKGFIIVFTCNTCPNAIAHEDRIIALAEKYNTNGYPVIAINPNYAGFFSLESFFMMKRKAKKKGFNFPYLYDEGQKITNQYGARVTPHVFLVKKEGMHYSVAYTGAIDNDTWGHNPEKTSYVEDAIHALEAGEEIRITSTKAIGCSVKRP